jgi:hypothetical protein
MPGIDASIPLGIKQPDQMQNLSSLLGVANGMQTLQQNQQKTQQGGMDLQERQGMQQFLSDPSNFTDAQGNLDPAKMQAGASRFAPTTGFKYMQAAAEAHKAHTEATKALNSLTADNRTQIGSVLSSLPPDAAPDLVHKTVDALNDQYKGRLSPLVSIFKGGYDNAVKTGGAQGATAFVKQQAQSVLPQTTQQEMNTPNGPMLTNGQQSVQVNTRPGVQGIAQGAPVPGTAVQQLIPVGQQEGVTNDSQGNMHVLRKDAFGNVIGTRPLQAVAPATPGAPAGPGPFTLPQGETKESMAELQAQRTAAQQAANTAPVMHDINQTIVREASKGLNTGTLGQLTQKLSSATGYTIGKDEATDYNLLGQDAGALGSHRCPEHGSAHQRRSGSLDSRQRLARIHPDGNQEDCAPERRTCERFGAVPGWAGKDDRQQPEQHLCQARVRPEVVQGRDPSSSAPEKRCGQRQPRGSLVRPEGSGRQGFDGAKKLHKQLTELLQLAGR